jgi:cobalt-zinc-cadmium efflux system membrane fusion protein
VKPNEPLALLDSLELGEKKSAFLQSRTNLEVARRNYAREERLFKQRISSEKEYLEAKGEFERSEAAFRAAREALRLVGLTDEEIDGIAWGGKGHPLSHFPLIAPFAGTVVEQHIAIGELVEPNETPYTIADLSTVWVLLDVFEKDIAHVRVGSEVRVAVDAYPGEMFRGTVAYLSNLLDPSTRTALARVEIDNRDGRLRPGMFATATISMPSASTGPGSFVVPRDAVQQVRGRAVAFVEEQPGTYRMRELGLGKDSGPEVEVLAGLTEGERVVTEGAFYLKSTLLKEEMGEHD